MLDFPSAPAVGDTYTGPSGQVWVWTGTQWTFAAATDTFLPLSGGTLTGPLILFEDAVDPLEAVPLQQLDNSLTGYLPLSGGTLTGNLSGTTAEFTGSVYSDTQLEVANIFAVNSGSLQSNVTGLFTGNLTAEGQLFIGSSGGFYLQDLISQGIRIINWAPSWYDSWNTSTGLRSWQSPGATLMWLDGGGNLSVQNNIASNSIGVANVIQAPNIVATGVMFVSSTVDQYYLNIDGAGNRVINFTPDGWHLVWQASSGNFIFYNNTGQPLWFIDAGGSCHISGSYIGGPGNFTGAVTATGDVTSGNNIVGQSCITQVGIWFNSQPGGNHSWSLLWEYQVANLASINIDGAAQYPLANAASDERLKLGIAPSRYNGLAAVLATPLFEYKWKSHSRPGFPSDDEDEASPLVPIGFVAQRMQGVFPYAVIPPPPESVQEYLLDQEPGALGCVWTLNDRVLLAAAYDAIKQLNARVVALENA